MGTLLLKFLLSTNKSGIGSPNWYRNGCSSTSGRLAVYGKIKGILICKKWLLQNYQVTENYAATYTSWTSLTNNTRFFPTHQPSLEA